MKKVRKRHSVFAQCFSLTSSAPGVIFNIECQMRTDSRPETPGSFTQIKSLVSWLMYHLPRYGQVSQFISLTRSETSAHLMNIPCHRHIILLLWLSHSFTHMSHVHACARMRENIYTRIMTSVDLWVNCDTKNWGIPVFLSWPPPSPRFLISGEAPSPKSTSATFMQGKPCLLGMISHDASCWVLEETGSDSKFIYIYLNFPEEGKWEVRKSPHPGRGWWESWEGFIYQPK